MPDPCLPWVINRRNISWDFGFEFLAAAELRYQISKGKSMNRTVKLLFSIATLMVFALPVLAQTQPAVDNGDQKSSINSRKEEQAKRLEHGVDNGNINKSEQHQIKHDERRMNHEERKMKAENGGTLTSADRAKLRRQQKHVSREITKDNHK
jgi:hypothetical protein